MADRPVKGTGSGRSMAQATGGMVACSQPLAAATALFVLMTGGNAVDAAVAAAAVLAVVEPAMTGIGGDMFALVFDPTTGKVYGLNGSGRAPAAADSEFFRHRGLAAVPMRGVYSVTVPGAVHGWQTLLDRFGSRSLGDLLLPAIGYAEAGFPVHEVIGGQWRRHAGLLAADPDAAAAFLIEGARAPRVGEVVRLPALARSLRLIAAEGPAAFYQGAIAQAIVASVAAKGGLLAAADLAAHASTWVEPLTANYRGYDVYELPPNGQGLVALEMLNILSGYDLRALGHNSADYLHLLVEAKKLAFADRDAYIADPARQNVPVAALLSKEYAARQRARIDPERAGAFGPGLEIPGDTVYFTVVDRGRMAVSFINSIFRPFGSGVVAGQTGIVLQNRGAGFSLDPAHPNCLEPGKRPFHTLIPAMVLKEGRPYFSFGVMGGDMQPQGHVQVLVNLLDFGMNVQEAGEAPRCRHVDGCLALEHGIGPDVRLDLADRGHSIVHQVDQFGGYQGIRIDPASGVLQGGSDPRRDGLAIGY